MSIALERRPRPSQGRTPLETIPLVKDLPKFGEKSDTVEEALANVHVALDAFENLAPPEIPLADTNPLTFEEMIMRRAEGYWMEHDPEFAMDSSPAALAFKINSPPELLGWAMAKANLADILLTQWGNYKRNFMPDDHSKPVSIDDPEEELGGHSYGELAAIRGGEIIVEVKDGRPSIQRADYAGMTRAALNALKDHHGEWDKRHRLLVKLPRLARVAKFISAGKPFLTKLDPNKPGNLSDVLMLHLLHDYQSQSAKKEN